VSTPSELTFYNCTLIDGTGAAARPASVTIRGDRIAAVDAPSDERSAGAVDATGLFCTPGFIDIHCHSDFACLLYPEAHAKAFAGVTTEVDGNCGFGAIPLAGEVLTRRQKDYAADGLQLDWRDFDGYAARVEGQGVSINRCLLVPHGNLRGSVMGYADRRPTDDELKQMQAELAGALEAGAFGMSTGLIYAPGCFADVEEMSALAGVVAEHDGYYASHIRSEGETLEGSIEEFLQVGRRSGVRLQLSHVKTAGRRHWHKIGWLRDRLFQARHEGQDLQCDRYPYVASSTGLDSFLLPSWALEGGLKAELGRLTDPTIRNELRTYALAKADADYWQQLIVTSVRSDENRHVEGRSMADIADALGTEPVEAAFDLIVAEEAGVSAIQFSMSEDNLREILSWPFVGVGSDSALKAPPGSGVTGKPHPRGFGTPTRLLAHYVRDLGLLSWEEGIHKLSGLPARMLGLRRRGTVAAGHAADLCLFRPEDLAEHATFQEPRRLSGGMSWVIVGGEAIIRGGKHTGLRPGRVLRRTDP